MKTREVIDYLDKMFKPEYQENYDNAGFLVGDMDGEYKGALVSVDVTPATVEEAIGKGLSLIVSHHPLIFSGMKRITNADATGRMVRRLVQNNISVYAAHTNLDNLDWGVNGILAQKLGLTDCRILRPVPSCTNTPLHQTTPTPQIGAGMTGLLPHPMDVCEFLKMVKQTLNLPVIRTSQITNHNLPIHKVAICGGSGSFLIGDAKRAGANIFMTGDLKYHDFQQSEDKVILADIGHYESEQFSKEIFYRVIKEKFSNFACQISEHSESYIHYI